MEIKEIENKLDQMFPTMGVEEDLSMEDAAVKGFLPIIDGAWDTFPETFQRKIETIEQNMCKRKPFALHLRRFLTDEDLEELYPID